MSSGGSPFSSSYSKSPSQYLLTSDDTAVWGDISMELCQDHSEGFVNRRDILPIGLHKDHFNDTMLVDSGSSSHLSFKQLKDKVCPVWRSVKAFVFIICVLITVHGTLATGYSMSVLTTIEKRFNIASKTAGFIISSYEFGTLLSVVFVSYFGSRGHIPRWIGFGGVVLSFGSFLFSLPHFIATPYAASFLNITKEVFLSTFKITPFVQKPELCKLATDYGNGTFIGNDTCSLTAKIPIGNYVFILSLAQILLGVGGSPLLTLGTAYIDNHVEKDSSSVYLAFLYVMLVFGPVCGFLLGGLMLSEFVNPSATPTDLTSDSSAWIGLWWGGFIICGFLYLVSALPFFCFPRHLSTASTCASDSDYGKDIRKIPLSIVHLLCNGVYVAATLAACMDLGIVSGVTVFLPKYLETQFRLSKSDASIFTGSVAIPGACVGTFIGGWVLKKYKLSVNSIAKYIITVNTVALLLLGMFFFIGCDNPNVAGVTVPYSSAAMYKYQDQSFYQARHLNLTNSCNAGCRCSLKEIHQVCGTDHVTYLSPCFAGCKSYRESAGSAMRSSIVGDVTLLNRNYSHCECIAPPVGASATYEPFATDGPCDTGCRMLVPFLIFLFVLTLAASNSQMPLLMITLRAVKEEEKAFALGIQTLLYRVLSYVPAPILYGAMIDTTCLVWDSYCGISGEACLLYDVKSFRYSLAIVAVVQKVVGFLFSLLLYWCIKRRYTPFSAPVTVSEIAHHLVDIESLNVQRCDTATSLRSWVSDDSLYSRPRSPRHQKTLSY